MCRIPNLPFFYLVYRAWSHWRALAGGRHLLWLVENNLVTPCPSATLDLLYSRDPPLLNPDASAEQERMLLTQKQVRRLSQTLKLPELEIELERAIWQVEKELGVEKPGGESQAEPPRQGKREKPQEPAEGSGAKPPCKHKP